MFKQALDSDARHIYLCRTLVDYHLVSRPHFLLGDGDSQYLYRGCREGNKEVIEVPVLVSGIDGSIFSDSGGSSTAYQILIPVLKLSLKITEGLGREDINGLGYMYGFGFDQSCRVACWIAESTSWEFFPLSASLFLIDTVNVAISDSVYDG